MKHYIILTPSIGNMGGSEMFTANKAIYLQNHGWDVRVYFSNLNKEIKIPELRQFSMNYIPEIGFAIYYINKQKRKFIIDTICDGIGDGDETIVESHLLGMGYWGELVAEKCNGKSILNAMEENINPLSENEAKFVEFKLKRWEILNSSAKSLHRYFNHRYKDEYALYTHNLMRAYCSNVTIDDDSFELNLPSADYNIISVGRLDKPYIKLMFNEILLFAKKYFFKQINILIVGGSHDGKVENEIKHLFHNISNVTLIFYGFLFPIPTSLLKAADVSIAMANSVLVTADMGIPTIALDIHDLQPIGIFERTTTNRFTRDKEPIQKISELLKEILLDGKYSKISPKNVNISKELEDVFGKQIKFLELSAKESSVYYDVNNIYTSWLTIYSQMKYYFIKQILNKTYI